MHIDGVIITIVYKENSIHSNQTVESCFVEILSGPNDWPRFRVCLRLKRLKRLKTARGGLLA